MVFKHTTRMTAIDLYRLRLEKLIGAIISVYGTQRDNPTLGLTLEQIADVMLQCGFTADSCLIDWNTVTDPVHCWSIRSSCDRGSS